jgi:hypothetical protein
MLFSRWRPCVALSLQFVSANVVSPVASVSSPAAMVSVERAPGHLLDETHGTQSS